LFGFYAHNQEDFMSAHTIDLRSTSFQTNPYPIYKQLRENSPVHWFPFDDLGRGMWLVTRYQDCARLLKDDQNITKNPALVRPPDPDEVFSSDLLSSDPPDHTRLRSLVNQAFTPKRIRDLEPRIRQLAEELFSSVKDRGEMDFMADFAIPMPIFVIAELLGVPREDRSLFRQWTNDFMRSVDAMSQTEETQKKGQEAGLKLLEYFTHLVQQRRQKPRMDLITGLTQARDGGDRLTEREMLEMCQILLIAGHETTVNLLGNGLLLLLQHTDQLAMLKQGPELMESAIEEMLRFESPIQRATVRFTTAPVEICGKVIDPGQQLSVVIGAANRDPEQFPDPDRFDIARNPNRHLAFGRGIHFCVGAPLARTEAHITFDLLLAEFPRLELVSSEPDWSGNTFLRGLNSLQVRLS
jgi:pimeloyl-[acyl-carrier protein] synthase